jgi:DNA-binding NarL/FixJ family response regulator
LFVEQHQGAITFETQEGQGTTFHVWLPQADFTEAERAWQLSRQRRRSLLLAGAAGKRLEDTAEFLRRHHYHVVLGGADAADLLRSNDYVFDAVLLQAESPGDQRVVELLRFIRAQNLPVKIIIETVGRDPDELPATLAVKADLVISAETPAETIPQRLAELFERPA